MHQYRSDETNEFDRRFTRCVRQIDTVGGVADNPRFAAEAAPSMNIAELIRYLGKLTVTACLIAVPVVAAGEKAETSPFSYGDQGWQYDDGTGDNFAWFGVRLQTRAANSRVTQTELPGDPVSQDSELAINRARLKLGGNVFSEDFTFYSEYDLVDSRLLDLRATYRFSDFLRVRTGQWKSEFNRERVDSSGKQQFVERSVVTPWFTVDRQQGVVASGRIGKGAPADSSYWFGWISGAGRGGDPSDADGLVLARWQWNFTGNLLGFSQSAVGRPDMPEGSVAVAAVSGNTPYTSFSSDGGGQIPGFSEGVTPGQYYLRQWLFETAYQHKGFSWQHEFHWKAINDELTGRTRRLRGGYAQAGMFFSESIDGFPEPLELAFRYARVDPDRDLPGDYEEEWTVAANWFFNGHRNKLTIDLSRVFRRLAPETDTSNRVRLQWDWSF